MRIKRWIVLSLAAVLTTAMLTGCPWDKEEDPGSSSSSSSSQSTGGSQNDSSSNGQQDTSKTYTVTAIIGEGGTVTSNKKPVSSGDTFKKILEGTQIQFTVTPSNGYKIADVIVAGGNVTNDSKGNYTLTVTGNCTVSVTFTGELQNVTFEPINGKDFDEVIRDILTKNNDNLYIEGIRTTYDPNDNEEYFQTIKILNRCLRNVLLTEGTEKATEVIAEKISEQLLDYIYGSDGGQDVLLCTGASGLHILQSYEIDNCTYLEVFDATTSESVKNAIAQQLTYLPDKPNGSGKDTYYHYGVVISGVTLGNKGYTAMLIMKFSNTTNSDIPAPIE